MRSRTALAVVLSLSACSYPELHYAEDAATDGPYVLPDGRVCTGHDEDDDGVPDECDVCPNVRDPAQVGEGIGEACAPSPTVPIGVARRAVFDPMTSLAGWTPTPLLGYALGEDSDSLVGGTPGDDVFYMATPTVSKTTAGAPLVVTTLVSIEQSGGGSAGILLRINGARTQFFACLVGADGGFVVAHAPTPPCTGSCTPVVFGGGDGGVLARDLPPAMPFAVGRAIGLRATVTAGTSGRFECRVFDPNAPGTLAEAAPTHALALDVPGADWLSVGSIGLFSYRARARFRSIDVLSGG